MIDSLIDNANLSIPDLAATFKTSVAAGLTTNQLTEKRAVFGFNEIKEAQTHSAITFIKQFASPFILIFFIIGGASLFMKEYTSAAIVFGCVIFNILATAYQEHKSRSYINALKKYLLQSVHVLRNGKTSTVSSKELLPGDIIFLQQGDIIPADVRFIEVNNLTLDQSTITGESTPIQKSAEPCSAQNVFDATNIGFSGSAVLNGQAKAMVLAIGSKTYFNKSTPDALNMKESDFHKKIDRFSLLLTAIILLSVVALFFMTLLFKSNIGFFNIFMFCTALGLTITPEALPAIVTFALSRAVSMLAKSNIIVKRFSGLQDMGSMDILCTDKTGTLTENQLTASEILPYQNSNPLFFAALASASPPAKGFDEAIVQALTPDDLNSLSCHEPIFTQSFDPAKRRNFCVMKNKQTGEYLAITRGSFEHVITRCDLSSEEINKLHDWIARESEQGKRSLAIAYKIMPKGDYTNHLWENEDTHLTLAGCISFYDPIKKTAAQTIESAKKLGVKLRILSGDMKEVCTLVATELNLISSPSEVMAGDEYMAKSEDEKNAAVEHIVVFARMLPEQKLDVLKHLQKKNYIVGYLGDGMNDIPALSIADIAITVENALDMVRDAADIILLKKSLFAIITGIKESRIVFANIHKYIYIIIAANFGNFFALAASSFILPFLPLLPIQVITNNFLTDLPAMALAADHVDAPTCRKPKKLNLSLILWVTVLFGLLTTFFDLIYFYIFRAYPESQFQTGFLILCGLTDIAIIMSLRSRFAAIHATPPSRMLTALSIGVIIAAIGLPYTRFGKEVIKLMPPTAYQLCVVFGLAILYFIANELAKKYAQQKNLL